MRHIVMCGLPSSTIIFHIFSWKARFSKKGTEHQMCILVFCTRFFWNISHVRRNERDVIKNIYRPSCEVPFILVRFWWNLKVIDRLKKKLELSNLMKIHPVGAEMFHADRRWGKQIVALRNFAKAPKHLNVI